MIDLAVIILKGKVATLELQLAETVTALTSTQKELTMLREELESLKREKRRQEKCVNQYAT